MNNEELEAFAREAAKGIKTEQGLNEFRQMLTKVTVERALNAELDGHLATISTSHETTLTALLVKLCAPKTINLN